MFTHTPRVTAAYSQIRDDTIPHSQVTFPITTQDSTKGTCHVVRVMSVVLSSKLNTHKSASFEANLMVTWIMLSIQKSENMEYSERKLIAL